MRVQLVSNIDCFTLLSDIQTNGLDVASTWPQRSLEVHWGSFTRPCHTLPKLFLLVYDHKAPEIDRVGLDDGLRTGCVSLGDLISVYDVLIALHA